MVVVPAAFGIEVLSGQTQPDVDDCAGVEECSAHSIVSGRPDGLAAFIDRAHRCAALVSDDPIKSTRVDQGDRARPGP